MFAEPILFKGTFLSLIFAFAAMFGGLVLGFLIAVARVVPSRITQWPATVYVSLFRGTPLLVQVFIVYYGLPSIGISFDPLTAGILALSLNAGAFISESLRGGDTGHRPGPVVGGLQPGPHLLAEPVLRRDATGPASGGSGDEQYADQSDQRHLPGLGDYGNRAVACHERCHRHHISASAAVPGRRLHLRSDKHNSELQSLMR